MSIQGSSIDVILTKKSRSFYKTYVIESGLSDHHKMVVTFLRSHNAIKTKPKSIIYRNIKNINSDTFKNDIKDI